MTLSFRDFFLLAEANIWDTVAQKFTQELVAAGQPPERAKQIVDSYIHKFRNTTVKHAPKLKDVQINVPAHRRNDISAYPTFHDLEVAVDYVEGQIKTGRPVEVDTKVDVNGYKIYADDVIEVYEGKDKQACIAIKGDMNYSWCIARSDANNMYYSYRFNMGEPSFYFVKNLYKLERSPTDPYSFFVVQKNNQGSYTVTSNRNDGDRRMLWKDIVKIEPRLRNLERLFQHRKLGTSEKADYQKYSRGIDDDTYRQLTFEQKERYIDVRLSLSDQQFADTPKELKRKYVNMGAKLSPDQLKSILETPSLVKRYVELSKETNPLKEAIGAGDIEHVKLLLQLGVEPKFENLKTVIRTYHDYDTHMKHDLLELLFKAGVKLDGYYLGDFLKLTGDKEDIALAAKHAQINLSEKDFYAYITDENMPALRFMLAKGFKPTKQILGFALDKDEGIFKMLRAAM